MCLIIGRPAKHALTQNIIEAAHRQNSDGWGIMYHRDNEVVVHKGMKLDDLLAVYGAIPDNQPLAIHFRWRTHGAIDDVNTHPYRVLNKEQHGTDLWCVHNGVIQITEVDKTRSDTLHWIDLKVVPVLSRDPTLLQVPEFQDMLEDGISNSRILFLDSEGNWTFLNRHSWIERDGCYYSTRPPSNWTTQAVTTVGAPYAAKASTKGKDENTSSPLTDAEWEEYYGSWDSKYGHNSRYSAPSVVGNTQPTASSKPAQAVVVAKPAQPIKVERLDRPETLTLPADEDDVLVLEDGDEDEEGALDEDLDDVTLQELATMRYDEIVDMLERFPGHMEALVADVLDLNWGAARAAIKYGPERVAFELQQACQ